MCPRPDHAGLGRWRIRGEAGTGHTVDSELEERLSEPDSCMDMSALCPLWTSSEERRKDLKLEGKVALVTGGSRGIGEAIVYALADEGASVAVNYVLNKGLAEQVCHNVHKRNKVNAIPLGADVSVAEEVDAMVDRAISELGKVDILVNNAGVDQVLVPTVEQSLEDWDSVIKVNLRGAYICSRRVGRWMVQQNRGAVLNIASILAFGGAPMATAYGPAKAGMVNLTQILAVEWAKNNIRVNCMAPGYIVTPLLESFIQSGKIDKGILEGRTSLGRLGKPDEVAKAAVFLVSDDASYITGVTLVVDGGLLARLY